VIGYDAYFEQLSDYIRKLVHLSDEQMALVLGFFRPVKLKRNEILLRAGEVGQYMNFVAQGCLRIYFIKSDGQDVTRYLAFENMFATGLASFISQKPSDEYIQTMEETIMLRISKKDFYYLLEIIEAWEKFFRKYLESAYMVNLDIFQREMTKSAEERYRELLSKNPDIVLRLPNKVVASYLNMSPETLSRMKKKIATGQ
jgi:CRP-like cAMP-binding protein